MRIRPDTLGMIMFYALTFIFLLFPEAVTPEFLLAMMLGVAFAGVFTTIMKVREVRLVLPDGSEKTIGIAYGEPDYDPNEKCYVIKSGFFRRETYKLFIPDWRKPWVTDVKWDLVAKVRGMIVDERPEEILHIITVFGRRITYAKEKVWTVASWIPEEVGEISYTAYSARLKISGGSLELDIGNAPISNFPTMFREPFIMIPVAMRSGKIQNVKISESKLILPTIITKKINLGELFVDTHLVAKTHLAMLKQIDTFKQKLDMHVDEWLKEASRSITETSRITRILSGILDLAHEVNKLKLLPHEIVQRALSLRELGVDVEKAIEEGAKQAIYARIGEMTKFLEKIEEAVGVYKGLEEMSAVTVPQETKKKKKS